MKNVTTSIQMRRLHHMILSSKKYCGDIKHTQSDIKMIFDEHYAMCVVSVKEILRSMIANGNRRVVCILDLRLRSHAIQILKHWFVKLCENWVCMGEQRFAEKYNKVLNIHKSQSSNEINYITIAGVCVMIAIKFHCDEDRIAMGNQDHFTYCKFVEANMDNNFSLQYMMVFYTKQTRKGCGMPDELHRDNWYRYVKMLIAHNRYSIHIESLILQDLEWRLNTPLEIDFIHSYASILASNLHTMNIQPPNDNIKGACSSNTTATREDGVSYASLEGEKHIFAARLQKILISMSQKEIFRRYFEPLSKHAPTKTPTWIVSLSIIFNVLRKLVYRKYPSLYETLRRSLISECVNM